MRSKSNELYVTILDYINSYYEKNAYSPSVRTISNDLNVSTATVSRYTQDLKERGEIEYEGHSGIITKQMKRKPSLIPIVGSVACGPLTEAIENIEGYVEISDVLSPHNKYFILRANGKSMINIGINDKDLVLIEQRNSAENGEVIVALIGGEATLKRFFKEKGKVRLHPENDDMEDIIVDDVLIRGVAKKIIKDIV